MKRILITFLALSMLLMGAGVASAQLDQDAPITPTSRVWAAWQPFEKGVMIWWSDLDQIWVLINPTDSNPNGQAYIYVDNWNGSSVNNTGAPPDNRFAPIRGFGYIWDTYLGGPSSGNQLGWALSEEIGFDSASRTFSGNTIVIGGPGDTEYSVSFLATAQSGVYVGTGNATFRVVNYG